MRTHVPVRGKKFQMEGAEQQLWKALKWMEAFDAFFIAQ
jgi:hypothetical protein